MKTINAIFISMAFAAILVAPANAGITTNAVGRDRAGVTNFSIDAQTVTTCNEGEACCEETTSPGHYSISPIAGLARTANVGRTRHAVTFFTDAAIGVGRGGGNAGGPGDANFSRFPTGGSWAGIDAGATPQPRGLQLFSWSW